MWGDKCMDNMFQKEELLSVYESMKNYYIVKCEQLDRSEKDLDRIENEIKDVNDYILFLEKYQNSDTFVFSPRGVHLRTDQNSPDGKFDTGKAIDFSDIEKKKSELLALENEKSSLTDKVTEYKKELSTYKLNLKILKDILDYYEKLNAEACLYQEKENFMKKEYSDKINDLLFSLNHNLFNKMEYFSHNIDLISDYIDSDPVRAKLELKEIKDNFKKMNEDIKEILVPKEGESKS